MFHSSALAMEIDLAVGSLLLIAGLTITMLRLTGRAGGLTQFRQSTWLPTSEWLFLASIILYPTKALFAPWVCLALALLLLLRPLVENGWLQSALAWSSGQLMLPIVMIAASLTLVFLPGLLDAWELERQATELENRQNTDWAAPILSEHTQTIGMTDSGQPIPLFSAQIDSDHLFNEIVWLGQGDWDFRVIRMAESNPDSNCHGHVFAYDRHWVMGRYVDTILRENQYSEIDTPLEGDVILYRNFEGTPSHTGIIRGRLPDGSPLVESKWGTLGIYLHPAIDCPYGRDQISYHRHPTKTTHHLDIEPR